MRYNSKLKAIKLNKRETEAYIRERPSRRVHVFSLKPRYEQEGSLDIRLAVADEMLEQGASRAVGCDGVIYDMAI